MTVIPSFLITGIVATVLGIITMIWVLVCVHRQHGGIILILLSITLLLVGGGLFPPAIGIIAGLMGTRINAPLTTQASSVANALAALWPWPLVAFFVWALGQFLVGHYFNDFMQQTGYLSPLLIVGLLVLSIASGRAYDLCGGDRSAAA
jgi:hypothetical protein